MRISDWSSDVCSSDLAGQGDEVLFSRFSFIVYDIAARRCGATPVEAPDRDQATDVAALLAAVRPHTRAVLGANPTIPTETYLPKSELDRLQSALIAGGLLVIEHGKGTRRERR